MTASKNSEKSHIYLKAMEIEFKMYKLRSGEAAGEKTHFCDFCKANTNELPGSKAKEVKSSHRYC